MRKKALVSISSLICLSLSALQVSNAASHEPNSCQTENNQSLSPVIEKSEQEVFQPDQQNKELDVNRDLASVLSVPDGEATMIYTEQTVHPHKRDRTLVRLCLIARYYLECVLS